MGLSDSPEPVHAANGGIKKIQKHGRDDSDGEEQGEAGARLAILLKKQCAVETHEIADLAAKLCLSRGGSHCQASVSPRICPA